MTTALHCAVRARGVDVVVSGDSSGAGAMAKRASCGFRWRDLSEEHRKAISFFTASKGPFPLFFPCTREADAYVACLERTSFQPELCGAEIRELTACTDRSKHVRA